MSIIKHGGSSRHSTIETLDDRWPRVSGRGGARLELFATFRLVVYFTASIQAEIEDGAYHTLVPWTRNAEKHV